jgi:hypothetical protein
VAGKDGPEKAASQIATNTVKVGLAQENKRLFRLAISVAG